MSIYIHCLSLLFPLFVTPASIPVNVTTVFSVLLMLLPLPECPSPSLTLAHPQTEHRPTRSPLMTSRLNSYQAQSLS